MDALDFPDFRSYFQHQVRARLVDKQGRKWSSLARLARDLGYSSPSVLSMVLTGQRLPSDELCGNISRRWNLSLKEAEYLRLLVEAERKARRGEDPAEARERIRRLLGKRSVRHFNDDEFAMIREWHYTVIRQLAGSPSFLEDPAWISRALRKKVSPTQVQEALARMERMGVLTRDPATGRLRASGESTETTHEVPSVSIRIHHRHMIQRALEALDERPLAERLFNSLTMNVDPARLPELKERVREFLRQLDSEFSADGALHVYQLNLQFFEHTQLPMSPGGTQ